MFVGIIESQSAILSVSKLGANVLIIASKPVSWQLKKGGSIAVDGICVTVVSSKRGTFSFDLMPETLLRTTAGSFVRGRVLNLERPLRYGGEIGGHFLQGHIDARGRVERMRHGASAEIFVSVPKQLMRYIAPKGSIAVNGVSLTVAKRTARGFAVALIPHTLAHTNLRGLKKGDHVNVEVDLIARYLDVLQKRR